MIRYAIDQEDGQTGRTDYTDATFFKKKRLKTMKLGGGNSNLYNEFYARNVKKEISECSSTPRK